MIYATFKQLSKWNILSHFDTQSELSAGQARLGRLEVAKAVGMELELGLGQCQQINEKHKQETRAGIGLIKWRFVSLIRIIIAGQTNPETGEKKSAVT